MPLLITYTYYIVNARFKHNTQATALLRLRRRALHNTQHPTTQHTTHIQRNCSYYSKNLILLLYIQWNIHSIEHTSNISITLTTVPYTRSGAAACVVVHIIVQHTTLHHYGVQIQ